MVVDRIFTWARSASKTGTVLLLVVLLWGAWAASYLGGGSSSVYPHLFYVPIVAAAAGTGPLLTLLISVGAGLLAGPLLPLDVDAATAQPAVNWAPRLIMFIVLGQFAAWTSMRGYSASLRTVEDWRSRRALRRALQHNEFELHYQPIVDLASRDIVGAEALLRWNRPGNGLVPPDRFIPAAEATGLIVDIGEWVLDTAIRQVGEWQRVTGNKDFFVSVNVSARQLETDQVVSVAQRAITAAGVAPSALQVEVTETGVLENTDLACELLGRLRLLGVSVCVDDFGVGQSSLAYLRRLPIDGVKIDRMFVADLSNGPSAEKLVAGIIRLASTLDLGVTAEGIEDGAQRERLVALGCARGQGYHLGRPVPAAEFEAAWFGVASHAAPTTAVALS